MDDKVQSIGGCRVCGSRATSYLCVTHNEHSKTETLSHYSCNECGSVFIGSDIDNEELGVAYSTVDSKKYFEEIEVENRKKMLKKYSKPLKTSILITPETVLLSILVFTKI